MVEQPIRNRQVVGSTPTLGSIYCKNLGSSPPVDSDDLLTLANNLLLIPASGAAVPSVSM